MKITTVILAAGQGTRMKSALPKVLHPLGGKPLIQHSLDLAASLSDELPVVVVGHGSDAVRKAAGERTRFAVQEQQLGTANAVQAAEPLLAKDGLVVVIYADMPLLTPATLQRMVAAQQKNSGPITMLTVMLDDSHGFGRVVRKADGSVAAIVEEAQCSPEQLAIKELNVGAYCFDARWLAGGLYRVPLSPKGEYYLTDTVGIAVSDGLRVEALPVAETAETLGINNRVHLAEAEAVLRRRINQQWMLAGVSMPDPETVYIEASVQIGADTVIHPNTHLRGKTVIGSGCAIGPNSVIADCTIANNCTVLAAFLEKAVMDEGAEIGPFGHLRKGAHLGQGVHMGNFGEVKNSYLAPGVKMGHFSYIGDAQIGSGTNIGAGTITCNYDGVHKFPTEIGEDVFIGSDTMLVAPLKIGKGAKTGAGAVVTHDVLPGEVVAGVPARPLRQAKEENG